MTEDGEKKKKDLVITKYTGLPFNCDLYDRSPWKCAEGIFFKWNGYSQKMKFIGLKNYRSLFSDKCFLVDLQ